MTAIVLPDNPFREGLDLRRVPEPSTMVIFGSTGDLSRRKLLPSLYVMHQQGVLPAGFSLVGFGRRPWQDAEFRAYVRDSLTESLGHIPEPEAWSGFEQALFFASGEFDDQEAFTGLASVLAQIDARRARTGNHLFYLAAPPSAYPPIIDGLGRAGLGGRGNGPGWARIVVEKPFGHDHSSATELNRQLKEWFREEQIFRIDHYLGKETVQNILVFRLANGIFEPVWDRQSVDHVQITVAEDLGVGTRGPYFEETGTMRDMIQNHVLQLLALVAMEPPPSFEPDAVRDERAKTLRAIRPLEGAEVDVEVVRGQYASGFIGGEAVPGIPAGVRGVSRFPGGDVRGSAGVHRQLAMGGGALLSPSRQTPASAGYGDRHPVQAASASPFRQGSLARAGTQRPCYAYSARRGDHAQGGVQAARTGPERPFSTHGFSLWHLVRPTIP